MTAVLNLITDKAPTNPSDNASDAFTTATSDATLTITINKVFPNETFEEEALKRVKIGMLLNVIIEDNEFKADPDKVKQIIEDRAKNYKEPQQVINYFYSDEEQLKNIESISLEEQVVDLLISSAKCTDEELTYEECISGNYQG